MANPFTSIATGVSSVSGFVIKLCEYTYALRAVDQQTEAYLTTAKHAWENIQTCRRLLQLRQEYLPVAERNDYERVLNEAKTAAEEVARLLEPARVDVESDGQIRFGTRMLWILRDDPAIVAALRRLNLVHTTLTQNISALRLMSGHSDNALELTKSYSSGREKLPSYESSQLLHWKRQTRQTREAQGLKISFSGDLPQSTDGTRLEVPEPCQRQRPSIFQTLSNPEQSPSITITHSPSQSSMRSSPSTTSASSGDSNQHRHSSSPFHTPTRGSLLFNTSHQRWTDPQPLRPPTDLDATRQGSGSPPARAPSFRNSWLHHQASRMDVRKRHHSFTGLDAQLHHGQNVGGLQNSQAGHIAELGAGGSRSLSFRLPRFEWEMDASGVDQS